MVFHLTTDSGGVYMTPRDGSSACVMCGHFVFSCVLTQGQCNRVREMLGTKFALFIDIASVWKAASMSTTIIVFVSLMAVTTCTSHQNSMEFLSEGTCVLSVM